MKKHFCRKLFSNTLWENGKTMAKKRMTKKERRRQKRRQRLLFCGGLLFVAVIFTAVLLLVSSRGCGTSKTQDGNRKVTPSEVSTQEPTAEPTPTSMPVPAVTISDINSKSGILVRLSDGEVVAEKEADARIYPASMTKIMTAIIGLENLTDLNETITIDRDTYDRLYTEGASLAGFGAGDEVKGIDILYGVMLPSGAECCVGLAQHLFGSEENFVAKMNEKAAELGMNDTHFVTCTGLHDENHYTTVRDLTKLLSYALKNDTFRQIYCSSEYTTSATASAPEGLHFLSTMFKKMDSPNVNGGEIEGGKTGYTSEAGQCLASLAKVDDVEYILVTAGAPGGPSTEAYHIEDAKTVYNRIQAGEPNATADPADTLQGGQETTGTDSAV